MLAAHLSTSLLSLMLFSAPLELAFAQTPAVSAGAVSSDAPGATPPVPPLPPSPVAFFRQLLEMKPEDRETALAEKSEKHRAYIVLKLQEYAGLSDDERELRLKLLDLHWYLIPLMGAGPSVRQQQLAHVPEDLRPFIEDRLRLWETLPPELQKEVIDNQMAARYFIRLEDSTPAQREAIISEVPLDKRKALDEKFIEWRTLPLEQRQRMYQHFHLFFTFTPEEKEKALDTLSDAERAAMEQALKAFESLSAEQREKCINSFRKLANMSPAERALFLNNAERWKEMSARERQTWRELVPAVPPLKPTFVNRPLPTGVPSTLPAPPTGTNKAAPRVPGSGYQAAPPDPQAIVR